MINFGNWQETEKLAGSNDWQNPHESGIAKLGQMLDPSTYIPGVNQLTNPIHEAATQVATGVNAGLSPVVGAIQDYEPGAVLATTINKQIGLDGIDRFVRNKPGDAAAIAAATFFSAGAASSALGPSAAAAPAASAGAGSTAVGGLSSFGAAGSAAITPALSSGAVAAGTGAGMQGAIGGTLGGVSGAGTLGTAGTAAATSALTPSFASMGGVGVGGFMNTARGYMDKASPYIDKAKQINHYRSNLGNYAESDPYADDATEQANALAAQLLDSNQAPDSQNNKIARQIFMNKFGAQ